MYLQFRQIGVSLLPSGWDKMPYPKSTQLHDGGGAVNGLETCGQGCQEVHLGM